MRIGLCGLGMMGQAHLGNALKSDELEVAALCDSDPTRLSLEEAVGGNLALQQAEGSLDGVPRYADFAEMLAQTELDAVALALPTDVHAEFAVQALQAGLHTFSEKPMALTVDGAEQMCQAARDAGRTLFIGHVVRFFPAYQAIHAMIRSGEHGAVVAAEFGRACGLPGWGGDSWFADPARSGGMPVDLHIHDVDFVRYALGEPSQVEAFRTRREASGVDVIRTQYEYGTEAVIGSYGAWLHRGAGFAAWASVIFERASVHWHTDRGDRLDLIVDGAGPQTTPLPEVDGYEAELREFVRGVESGQPSEICTPESAMASLALVYKEMEAAEAGARLRLEEPA